LEPAVRGWSIILGLIWPLLCFRWPARAVGASLDTTDADDAERFRPQARAAFCTALTTFAVAGILAILGFASFAAGLAWIGGASLLLSVIYLIMYRV
jgi:membrane-bound ClpP family serine protease